MLDDSGNQSLTARAATEDTNMPAPVYCCHQALYLV